LKTPLQPKPPANRDLKIAFIGCGRVAETYYLPALKKFSDVQVAVVVDPIPERREFFKGEFENCIQYPSLESKVSTETPGLIDRIDAAIITTPPDTHVYLAGRLLARDKPVLVEKPLACTTDGIQDLISTESSSQGWLMMGFNYRYWQPAIDLKNMLSKNPEIASVEMKFTSNYKRWNPISFISDPLDDLGPHVFDLVRYVFGREIRSIRAVIMGNDKFRFEIGISDNICIHCLIGHCGDSTRSIKLTSNGKTYFIQHKSVRISTGLNRAGGIIDLYDRVKRKLLRQSSPIKNTFEKQLHHFFNGLRLNQSADPGIGDGLAAILAAEAARESINNRGKQVWLDEIK
jgi:predicted dehydrogenase